MCIQNMLSIVFQFWNILTMANEGRKPLYSFTAKYFCSSLFHFLLNTEKQSGMWHSEKFKTGIIMVGIFGLYESSGIGIYTKIIYKSTVW